MSRPNVIPKQRTSDAVRIYSLGESDFESAAVVVGQVLDQPAEEADISVWRWRTIENPADRLGNGTYGWILRDRIGASLGVLLSTPQLFWVNGREEHAEVASHYAVVPEHRPQGFLLVSSFVQQRTPALLLNTSANPQSTEICRRLGFQESPGWNDVFVWVLSPGAFFAALAVSHGVLPPRAVQWIGGLPTARSMRWKRGWPTRLSKRIVTSEIDQISDEFDELWHELRRQHTFTAVRSSAFLSWRLLGHPLPTHRCRLITARDERDRLRGYVAWRRVGTRGIPLERARILDLFAPIDEPTVVDALLAATIRSAASSGVAVLEITHVFAGLRRHLTQLSVLRRLTTSGGYLLKWRVATARPRPDQWSISGIDGDFAM